MIGKTAVIFGFNTNVRVGKRSFHVQTEDRGPNNPMIDTTVYLGGRVVHRRSQSYKKLLESPDTTGDILREWLEGQHRAIIDELRAGTPKLDAPAEARTDQPSGVQAQLLNPASWYASGTATLKIEVRSRPADQPVADAQVEVIIQGAQGPVAFAGKTDRSGRVELIFPLPRLGPGGAELVIRATASSGEDEIRYSFRPKAKPHVA